MLPYFKNIYSKKALKFTIGLTAADVVYNISYSIVSSINDPTVPPKPIENDKVVSPNLFQQIAVPIIEEMIFRLPLVATYPLYTIPSAIYLGATAINIPYLYE